jgi:hypothetical protein
MIVTKTKSAVSRPKNRKPQQVTVSTVRTVATPQKKKNNSSGNKSKSSIGGLTSAYFNSLVDPWEYSGCKLGWGCMSPSACTTIYLRGTTSANSDGSLALATIPSAANCLQIWNGGAAVTTSSTVAATDSGSIANNYSAGRVISIGIKAFPSIAATAAPGVAYSGAIEGISNSIISGMAPNDFVANPNTRQDIASLGASATGRPQDTNSFIFSGPVVNATGFSNSPNTTTLYPTTTPFIAFTGLPSSASVAYEVVINVECLLLTVHSSAALGGMAFGDSLANYWSSFEQMWGKFQHQLPFSGQAFDVSDNLAQFHTTLGRLAGAGISLAIPGFHGATRALRYGN